MSDDLYKKIENNIDNLPFAACKVDEEGAIKSANPMMKQVFAYEGIAGANFFALTGVKIQELLNFDVEGQIETQKEEILIERNEHYFSLLANKDASMKDIINVYFFDVTEREKLRKQNLDKQLCLMYVCIDNYDELISRNNDDGRMALPAKVGKIVRKWAEKASASIENVNEYTYQLTIYRKDAEKIIEGKFDILDEVREIETSSDFPVSLSIGVGMGAENPDEILELASAARDLAMGRGGDQAVVKNGDRTEYYGGTLQSVEKNNKGKSRVIAHALKNLICESASVFIMGHKWPDMDSFGSAIGAYKLVKYLGKEARIILEEYNEALQVIYKQAAETEDYKIINREKAKEVCNGNDLVIIVDTSRPSLIECPEIIEKAGKVVVIDHHRLSDDALRDTTLSYIESYASSASELMTEIIQYSAPKRIINKFEAEAMLAGITVDTNSFSIKTGVRTFEAAAWLRRAGADTTEVKRFFQTDVTAFQIKSEALANAEYQSNGVAISITEGITTDAQIINAQVADALLAVKGVKVAFALGKNDRQKTVISGRSLGDINVQIILEKFGGGGHLTSAGAQVDEEPEEIVEKLKKILREDPKLSDKEE